MYKFDSQQLENNHKLSGSPKDFNKEINTAEVTNLKQVKPELIKNNYQNSTMIETPRNETKAYKLKERLKNDEISCNKR